MAEAPPATAAAGGMRLDPAHQRAALIILSAIALMVQYVETMVLPAIPTFIRFFQLTSNGVPTATWVLTAYLLVGTVATPIFSKLGDIVGKKRMLILTMAIYAIAVSVAGFTPNIASLLGWSRPNAIYLFIAVRGVQGIGIAMFPLAFAIISEQFPPNRIGTAQGIVSAMFAAGASAGLVGGAWITDTFGWQATYHSIIPFAFLILLLAILLLPPTRVRHAVPLDVGGAATLGVALGGFLVALSEGPTWGWTRWSSVSVAGLPLGVPDFLILGVVGLVAFFVWEPFAASPIVDFARLKARNVWISNVVGATTSAGMFIIFVSVVYIIQAPTTAYGLGQSIFVSGLLFVPSTLSMLFLGPVIGRSLARVGPRPLMIFGGVLVMAGGLLLYAFNRTETQFLLAPIAALVGMVMTFIAVINVVVLASRPQEVTIQTGMNQTFRNIGMAIGPALAATILTSFSFAWAVPGTFGRVTIPYPTLTGYEYAFLTTAALGAVGAVLSIFLRNYRYLADGTRVDGPAATTAVASPGAPAAQTESR
jgi:MFS family permease